MKKIVLTLPALIALKIGVYGASLAPIVSYYGTGGIENNFHDDTMDGVDRIADYGYSAEGETKSSTGWGIGLEFIHPIDNYDVGIMAEYVKGPTVEQDVSLIDYPQYWIHAKTETNYTRIMGTGGIRFPLSQKKRNYFKVNIGLGVAEGNMDGSGEASTEMEYYFGDLSDSGSDSWTGLTGMIGASFIIGGNNADLEFGARISKFPNSGSSDDFVEIEYMPLSIFGSLRFNLNKPT